MSVDSGPSTARIEFAEAPSVVTVRLSGDWNIERGIPATGDLDRRLTGMQRLCFESDGLGEWDSSLLSVVTRLVKAGEAGDVRVEMDGLPAGVQSLIRLSRAVPPTETSRDTTRPGFLARVGAASSELVADTLSIVTFLGEAVLLIGKFVTGRARYQKSELALNIQQAGAEALPIATVINFLIGLILAFVGALQLQKFGAAIYVADLVGVGMTREMAPLMTAIIMSGRTGAAYAAQLGTMMVNEEVDAMTTFGIPPLEFLVLPRMLALIVMMPLLTLYAMAIGIVAGGLSAWGVLDISLTEYMTQTVSAVRPTDIVTGLAKASVFGALVAMAGCLRGMQSGRNAAAVGKAATSAVVTSIVLIIVVDAIFNVVMQAQGI